MHSLTVFSMHLQHFKSTTKTAGLTVLKYFLFSITTLHNSTQPTQLQQIFALLFCFFAFFNFFRLEYI